MRLTWTQGAANRQPKKKRARRRPPALATGGERTAPTDSTPNYYYAIEDPVMNLGSCGSLTLDQDAHVREFWSLEGCPDNGSERSNHPLSFFVDDATDVAELWMLGREPSGSTNGSGSEVGVVEPVSLELDSAPGGREDSTAADASRIGDEDAIDDSPCESIEGPSPAARTDSMLEIEGNELDVIEGSNFNRNIASFKDPHGSNKTSHFTAMIDWGDDSISSGTIISDGSRFRVSGRHVYASHGVYSALVRIRGNECLEAEATSTITVHDAELHSTGRFVRAAAGREFNVAVAHFRDQNPFSEPGHFSARIDWGDGLSSSGTIAANLDGGYDIVGTHAFLTAGNYPAEVRITSHGGATASARMSIRVDEVCILARGLTAVTVVGSESELTVAAFEDSDRRASPDLYSARIDWADGMISDATIASNPSGGFRVIGGHCYHQTGLFSIRVTIRDHSGHVAATTGTVRVIS